MSQGCQMAPTDPGMQMVDYFRELLTELGA